MIMYLKQAKDFIQWLAKREPLPEEPKHQRVKEGPSFLKWLLASEFLEKKESVARDVRPNLIAWMFQKERLEEKVEAGERRKNLLSWIFEGDPL